MNPPKVRIALIGFLRQELISADQIVQALALLPDRHLADLLCVKYDPDRNVKFSGWYDPNQKGIEVFWFKDEWDFYQLLYHEIAHHVFHNALTIDERAMWVNEISPLEGHVSTYAEKNTSEDFAETYALYVLGPVHLLDFQVKFLFMNQVVFSGYIPDPSSLAA